VLDRIEFLNHFRPLPLGVGSARRLSERPALATPPAGGAHRLAEHLDHQGLELRVIRSQPLELAELLSRPVAQLEIRISINPRIGERVVPSSAHRRIRCEAIFNSLVELNAEQPQVERMMWRPRFRLGLRRFQTLNLVLVLSVLQQAAVSIEIIDPSYASQREGGSAP
jgi:hypothetical protein